MMKKEIDRAALPYRPCVGIALFNKEGNVFVGERIDTQGAWQMPQGGIDEGEALNIAALRELYEETGVRKAELLDAPLCTTRYDLPDHLLGVGPNSRLLWNGRYRGQEQSWVPLLFKGNEADINLNAHEPAEFSRWQWVELEKTIDLIVPFKQGVYKQVIEAYKNLPALIRG